MMCQRDRLCFLQMGKSRHIRMQVLFHNMIQSYQQFFHQLIQFFDLVSDIQFHVQRHLVISAPSGMQFLSDISDPVDQVCLHKTVNIFVLTGNLQLAGIHIRHDAVQSTDDLLFLFFCQDSLFCKHGYMGFASLYILMEKLLIKTDGRIKIIYKFVRFFCKTASP